MHVTNDEVFNKIQNAIGNHDEVLTIVKKHKLRWSYLKSLARNSQKNKKERKTEKEAGRQHKRLDTTGIRAVVKVQTYMKPL